MHSQNQPGNKMWPRRASTLLICHVLIVLAVLVFLLMHAIPSDMFTDQPARIDKELTSTLSCIDKGPTSTPSRIDKQLTSTLSRIDKGLTSTPSRIDKELTSTPSRIDKGLTSTPSRIDKGLTSTPSRNQTGLIFTEDNKSSQAKMLRTDQPPNERKPRNEDTAERGDDVVAGRLNLSSPYVISWEEHTACMNVDERKDRQQTSDVKLIVYWQDDEHFPETSFDDLCSRPDRPSCKLTFDISQHAKADAVVFHSSRIGITKPPFGKRPGQVWVARALEAPTHWLQGYASPAWRGAFNWTMTYRTDADIFSPVGTLVPLPIPPKKDYKAIASGKTRSIAWFVSKCKTTYQYGSEREIYVKELKKYIDVDIFGECGPHKCPKSRRTVCLDMLREKYRFYLAFENSLCQGYVTEKFFNKFSEDVDIVLVVLGGFDYKRYLPEGTYINAADFRSPKDLARHLLALGKNVGAYAAMLERKSQYTNSHCGRKEPWCKLCDMLHTKNLTSKVYQDLSRWWQEGTCVTAKELFHH